MLIVIIGGGKVGSHLSRMLADEGYEVTIVEVDPEKCQQLAEQMDKVKVICGDGDEPNVLDEADVRAANAVVAATGDDEDNLVVCLLGKMEYNVPLTIARNNNPANEWLFTETFGVDMMVSNTQMMAELLNKCVVAAPRPE